MIFYRKCIGSIRVGFPASYVSLPECRIFFGGGGGGKGDFFKGVGVVVWWV